MSDPTQKVERSLFKLFLWSGGILALIIALSVGGHRSFRRWQQHHLATQANAFFERGDYKRAGLDARRMMQLDPNSVEANRMMGRLSEKAGLRPAVDWYRRVVELTGGVNPDDVFALARAALRFRETATAEMAVAKLPPAVRETAAFHDLAADLALARQDGPAVVHELELATKTDPANKRYALRFATVRLISADSAVQEQGRASLATLQKDPGVGLAATRQLAADALRRKDFERALSLAEQLQSWPDKTFADRLLLLDIRQRSGDAGFEQLLAQLKTDAQGKPQDLADLLNWLNGHGMAARAIEWSATLPPELVAKRPVPLTLADSFITLRDWNGLLKLTKTAKWNDLDFLRLALEARALRELGNDAESHTQWSAAVTKTTGRTDSALLLAETAQRWGWKDESIELLWIASKDPVKGAAALDALYNYFAATGATQDLYRALLHMEENRPNDERVQNNVAQVALLLHLNLEHGEKLARDLHAKVPEKADYAATYAFALFTRGDTKNAAKVMGALPDDQLRRPEIAAYYGVILAAVGDRTRASEFLDLGEKAHLLPEEKALVEKARRSLTGP